MSSSYREHFAPRLLGKSRFISLLLVSLVATLLGAAPAKAAPATPTITSLSGGNGYITVNFSGGSGATGFKYQLSTDDGANWTSPAFVADVAGARDTTSPLNIFGMANATYKVRLIASDGTGDSAPAEFASPVTTGPKTAYAVSGEFETHFLWEPTRK